MTKTGNTVSDTTWAAIDMGTPLYAVKSLKGFCSEEFISARGQNPFGNGSGGGNEGDSNLTLTIDEVVNMPISMARYYAYNAGKARFTVLKDDFIVGALDLISDSSGHTLTQIFTTHYSDPQPDGSFYSHTDDKIYTFVRHIGLTKTAQIDQSWSEWEVKNDARDSEIMAKRIPPVFNPSSYWNDNPSTWTLETLLTEIEETSDLGYLKVSGTIVTFQTDGGNIWANAGDVMAYFKRN